MKEIVLPLPTEMDSQEVNTAKRLASEHWGGFTATEASGGWKAPDGSVVTEPVEVLTIVADDSHEEDETTPKQWAQTVAKCLARNTAQEEVMWFIRHIHAGGFETGD
jgi:hypothetical protein